MNRPQTEFSFQFPLRVVQLDLARQVETMEFIRLFIDYSAKNGFNALALYLEGRIRTESFPFLPERESYTPTEITEIVQYASTKGIEVIPVVSTLGHAELFLRHPEMAHLAETREPFSGRFGKNAFHQAFCPSLPATYQFLDRYLSEIASLFPSGYFHIGCDETWDMACCDLCRTQSGEGAIFLAHVEKIHAIISKKLGKRALIWDDMLFFHPEVLDSLPRDIVLACWQYQDRVDTPRGHFLHRERLDLLSRYDQLGFDYIICPTDWLLENAETFTLYGAQHRPLGGWLTQWEKIELSSISSLPAVGAVGRLWQSGKAQEITPLLYEAVSELFGFSDPVFLQIFRALYRHPIYLERLSTLERFLTQRENGGDYSRESIVDLSLSILPSYLDRSPIPARLVLEELLQTLESEQINHRLKRLAPAMLEGGSDDKSGEWQTLISRVESLRDHRLAFWQTVRTGLPDTPLSRLYNQYLTALNTFPSIAASHGYLKVHFVLPDQYLAQKTRFLIRYESQEAPVEISTSVFKESDFFDAYYSRLFPISRTDTPKELIVETWGYGGQGFTWFELVNDRGRFLPSAVEIQSGTVTDPDHLLRPDWKGTFAGQRDGYLSYFSRNEAEQIHRFHVKLCH